jgi:hypothetical protein
MNSDNFKVHPSKKDGFSDNCRKCQEEYSHNNYMKNREKQIVDAQKRQEGHKEELQDYYHERYLRQKEEFLKRARKRRIEKKDEIRIVAKEYYKNNPEKFTIYTQNRQHKNHNITKSEWENCKKYFNYTCAYCELPISQHYYTRNGITKLGDFHREHADHEGNNDLSNCLPSCGSCNDKKWKFALDEWYNKGNKNFTQKRFDKILKWLLEDCFKYIEEKKPKQKYERKNKVIKLN